MARCPRNERVWLVARSSAPESQLLAQEEVPLLLLLYSSGRVALLLTTITAVFASHVLTFTTRHLTPRILPSHGILPMLQPLMGDPPDALRTPWSSTRHHRCDGSPGIAITDTLRAIARHPEPSVHMTRCRALSPVIPPEIKGIKWRMGHVSHPLVCRRDTLSSALCCLAGPNGP